MSSPADKQAAGPQDTGLRRKHVDPADSSTSRRPTERPPSKPPEIADLVRRLADAEAALRHANAGKIDAVVLPEGHGFLLADAQRALVGSEARAKEQAAFLEAVLTNAPDRITYVDRHGIIRFANHALSPLGREARVGSPWLSPDLAEAVREPLQAAFDAVLEAGTVHEQECVGRGPDGADVTYSLRLGPVRRGAEVVGVVVLARDVTERRRMEQEIREARVLAESILTTVHEPLVVLDRELRVVTANRSFMRTFHATDGVDGTTLFELGSGRWETPGLKAALDSVLPKAMELRDYELEHELPKQGKRTLLLNARRVQHADPERELMLLGFQDVTERDERIRLTERQRQLEAANVELDAFAHSVAHDLRAPLRKIAGFCGVIVEDYEADLPVEARELFGRVTQAVARMNELVDDLLQFSRTVRMKPSPRPLDMTALAGATFAELATLEPARRIDFSIGDLPEARADFGLMRQVWENLLANAIKYTSRREDARIRVSGRIVADENVYTVEDNGAGFEMAQAGRLFGVFQRLHPAKVFEGTGVGLALVRRIVERHGGRIWAEAAPGVGATFTFSLPRKP